MLSVNERRCSSANSTKAFTQALQSAAGSGCAANIDIVLLQECPSWPCSSLFVGDSSWCVLGERDNGTAIAVSGRVRGTILRHDVGLRHTFLVTTNHMFVSCCMPDSSYGVNEDGRTIDAIYRTVKAQRGRGRHRKNILVGGDLNISVGLDGVTGTCVPNERAQRSRCCRSSGKALGVDPLGSGVRPQFLDHDGRKPRGI